LVSGRSPLLHHFTRRAIKLTAVIIKAYHCYQLHIKFYSNMLLSRLSPYVDEIIGNNQCGFQCNRSTTDQIFCTGQMLEKKWEYNETVYQLFIDFKKAYDSVRMEVLYNILIEFGLPMTLLD
jgi:sorting nexin-29